MLERCGHDVEALYLSLIPDEFIPECIGPIKLTGTVAATPVVTIVENWLLLRTLV